MRVILTTTTWFGMQVAYDLRAAGAMVTEARDRYEILASLEMINRGVILIERDLPGVNWPSLLREIRAAQPGAAILALSSSGSLAHEVAVLADGVDDVLCPRMSEMEIRARILKVLTRRSGFATPVLRLGALTVDTLRRRAFWASQSLALSPSLYDLLEHLVLHAGCVISKEEVMGLLYGVEEGVESSTLDVFFHKLRHRLQEAGAPDDVIISVQGRGKCLVTPERRAVDRDEGRDWLSFLNRAA